MIVEFVVKRLINSSEKRTSCSPSSPRWLLSFGKEETYENAESTKSKAEMLTSPNQMLTKAKAETLTC